MGKILKPSEEQEWLARIYGVSVFTIADIKSGRTWRDVEPA